MFRRLLVALAAAAPALSAGVASAESFTTRIEPRPYYGAVVTLEQGVRVWRPLPPTRHMIINPTNAPVHLSYADVRETHTSTNHNYNYGGAAPVAADGPVAVPGYGYYGRPFRHRTNGRHRPGRGLGLPSRRH